MKDFEQETRDRIDANGNDQELKSNANAFLASSLDAQYSYNFSWLGRPIIQYPQDMVAMQELIWSIQPDLIIEIGIAHGGSLIFSASMLELNAACGGPSDARVVGVDIDIRAHNKVAIEAHPMSRRIDMIEGSSIAAEVIDQVKAQTGTREKVLVFLDSNHTHDHVLAELEAYAPLASPGSYCVVFDTLIEDFPQQTSVDRPWGKGDNPKTAAQKYLESHPEFVVDRNFDNKLLISAAPDGYLRRKT